MTVPGCLFAPLISGGANLSAIEALQNLSLTTGLKLCLDAGDASSYTSGQSWLDRSGNGYDFFRGTTSGADATDPTFNGVAGGLSNNEYWSFDGGDYFTYDSANEAWMYALHKDNAKFSVVIFFYHGTTHSFGLLGTGGISTTPAGISLYADGSGDITLDVTNGGGNALSATADAPILSTSAWHMVGVSLDEAVGAGGGFLYGDGAYRQVSGGNTFNSTYSSPSTASSSYTLQIGALGNGTFVIPNDGKLGIVLFWEGTALTKANMDSIWAELRGRYEI